MSNFNPNKYLHRETQIITPPWFMLPFILTLAGIPFILGLYSFSPELGEHYFTTGSTADDIFLHYKSVYLIILGGIMAIALLAYRFISQKKFSFGYAMIPVYVYMGCVILSTIFSTSRQHSLHGIQHHFESVFVLLTYCILVMYAVYFVDSEKNLKWFINGFLIGVALLALFGVLQYSSGLIQSLYTNGTLSAKGGFYDFMNKIFGCIEKDGTLSMPWYEKLEPFRTRWMAEYVYMPVLENGQKASKLTLNFPLGQVFLTLYNPNYVAFFTTLTAPFFAALAFFQTKLWRKIVFAIVSLASITCLIGSRSVAGFLSVFVSLGVLIVAFRKKIFKHWIPWLCALGIFIVGMFVFDMVSGHAVLNKLNYAWQKIQVGAIDGYETDEKYHFTNLTGSADGIVINHKDSPVTFTMNYDSQKGLVCEFKDEDGTPLKTKTVTDTNGAKSVIVTSDGYADKELMAICNEDAYIPTCTLIVDGASWSITNQIPTMCYSYDPSETTNHNPFTAIQKGHDETIGDYYYFVSLPKSSVSEMFQTFIDDPETLKVCLNQLSKADSAYAEARDTIFNSSNPSQAALEYLNQLLNNPNALNIFFYQMSKTSKTDENYYYNNQFGKWTAIGQKPTTALFESHPGLASGRGFIWARTIPIIFKSAHNFLIGTGPDTFVFQFPHYDYVDAYRAGYGNQIVTKPHSLFLQVAVQTGLPSALAIIALYVIYLVMTVRLYWKSDFSTYTSKVSVAILASVSGYMFSAITNDSTVTYSYVFWGLIGVGIAVNRLELKLRQEEAEAAEKAARLEQQRQLREEKKRQQKAAQK